MPHKPFFIVLCAFIMTVFAAPVAAQDVVEPSVQIDTSILDDLDPSGAKGNGYKVIPLGEPAQMKKRAQPKLTTPTATAPAKTIKAQKKIETKKPASRHSTKKVPLPDRKPSGLAAKKTTPAVSAKITAPVPAPAVKKAEPTKQAAAPPKKKEEEQKAPKTAEGYVVKGTRTGPAVVASPTTSVTVEALHIPRRPNDHPEAKNKAVEKPVAQPETLRPGDMKALATFKPDPKIEPELAADPALSAPEAAPVPLTIEQSEGLERVILPFKTQTADIDPGIKSALKKEIMPLLRANPDWQVQIKAFAHMIENKAIPLPGQDKRLSLDRALSVREWLVSQGIPPSRLDIRPMGRDGRNDTDSNRVDLLLLDTITN